MIKSTLIKLLILSGATGFHSAYAQNMTMPSVAAPAAPSAVATMMPSTPTGVPNVEQFRPAGAPITSLMLKSSTGDMLFVLTHLRGVY